MPDLDATRTNSRSLPPKLVKLAPWFAGLLLLVGVVVFAGHEWPTKSAATAPLNPSPGAQVVKPAAPATAIKLPRAARLVAGRFILTAVQRKHLAEAWSLASPSMRQGISRVQWLKGNMPVVPFLTPIGLAPLHVVYAHPQKALLEVALLPAKGSQAKPQDFFLTLVSVHGRWYADNWVPRAAPAFPVRAGG